MSMNYAICQHCQFVCELASSLTRSDSYCPNCYKTLLCYIHEGKIRCLGCKRYHFDTMYAKYMFSCSKCSKVTWVYRNQTFDQIQDAKRAVKLNKRKPYIPKLQIANMVSNNIHRETEQVKLRLSKHESVDIVSQPCKLQISNTVAHEVRREWNSLSNQVARAIAEKAEIIKELCSLIQSS